MMLIEVFKNLYNIFLNLIYKQKCIICACSKTDDILCNNCAKNVDNLSTFAHKIYKEIPIYSAYFYSRTIKKLIHLLKFSHRKCCAKPLAQLLFKYFKKLELKDDYIIIFPDVFFLKKASRGYNHMAIIAKEFSYLTGYKIEENLIKKIKYTAPQYKAKNRAKNIKNSFIVNKKTAFKLKDKNFLLIDDIITSGATLYEIIDILKEEGIKNIVCLTISKAGN